jgi:hypothetical protein
LLRALAGRPAPHAAHARARVRAGVPARRLPALAVLHGAAVPLRSELLARPAALADVPPLAEVLRGGAALVLLSAEAPAQSSAVAEIPPFSAALRGAAGLVLLSAEAPAQSSRLAEIPPLSVKEPLHLATVPARQSRWAKAPQFVAVLPDVPLMVRLSETVPAQ